jgi:hypothetical protein
MKPQATPQRTSKLTSKRKDIEIQDPQTLIKEGLAAPSLDLMLLDDMDTSNVSETQPNLPKVDLPKTPPHFFKATCTRKKVAISSQKSGDH